MARRYLPRYRPECLPASGDPDLVWEAPPCRPPSARDGPKPVRGRGEKKTARDLQQHHLRDLATGDRASRAPSCQHPRPINWSSDRHCSIEPPPAEHFSFRPPQDKMLSRAARPALRAGAAFPSRYVFDAGGRAAALHGRPPLPLQARTRLDTGSSWPGRCRSLQLRWGNGLGTQQADMSP